MPRKYLLTTIQEDTIMKSRWPLLKAMQGLGWDVHVAMPRSHWTQVLEANGVTVHEYDLRRGSMNPFREGKTLAQYRAILRTVNPTLAHHFSTKAVIYGSLAGSGLAVSTITGIGHSLSGGKGIKSVPVRALAPTLYRTALRRCRRVIFQNEGDQKVFLDGGMVRDGQVTLIQGSGVDMEYYHPSKRGATNCRVRFVMLSRMIASKGVREFAQAAQIAHEAMPGRCEFALVGPLDPENPSCIKAREIEDWQGSGLVSWRGAVKDATEAYREADVAVLPSYAEGLPRAVVEGAAMALPAITTTHPGCAATVLDGKSGLLVPPRDGEALGRACLKLAARSNVEREQMGLQGRGYVEERFSVDRVLEQTLQVYDEELVRAGERGLAA